MSVSAVGSSVQPSYAAPESPSRPDAAAPEKAASPEGLPREGSDRELTTVTTHCDKNHRHTQSCLHTVYTRPAPQPGEPGFYLDTQA